MNETLILNIVGFGVAVLLLCFVTHRAGSGSTFAHLFSILWGPCILAAQFLTTSTNTLSMKTLIILFTAWWALLAGALLTIRRQPKIAPREVTINRRRAIAAIIVLFSLHATLVVYEMPTVDVKQPTVKLVRTLRMANESSGLRKCPWWLEIFRGAYFVYIPLAVLVRKRGWLSRRSFCILVAGACGLVLTRMTRAPLMGTLVALWGSWALLYKPRVLRAWALLAGVIVAFSTVFLTIQSNLQGNTHATTVVELVEQYYGGSMRAFESVIDGTFPRQDGYYSADMFYYTLQKVELIDSNSYPSSARPYGDNKTNIYTFLDVYTLDAGVFGAILGAALVGAAGGWLFNKASRCHSPMMLAWNAFFIYGIAMAVANNEFIRINLPMTFVLASIVSHCVVQRRVGRPTTFLSTARDLSSGRRSLPALSSM
jgi:oligosaccharide repeat unit polymerase